MEISLENLYVDTEAKGLSQILLLICSLVFYNIAGLPIPWQDSITFMSYVHHAPHKKKTMIAY